MKYVCAVIAMFVLTCLANAADPKIVGEPKYDAYRLARFRAENVDAKAAILWRVHPSDGVDKANTARGVLEFAAKPGNYSVELLVISTGADGTMNVHESSVAVAIAQGSTPPPGPSPPGNPGQGKLDAVNALGRIRFGSAGCTATIIGPRRPDGRWDVVTASHCIARVGDRGTFAVKDGRTLNIQVVGFHREPDVAWCVTDETYPDLSYANLAPANPVNGTKVWHMGYGVDRPGNREDGVVTSSETGGGQTQMTLNVSSGDSGGGIFRTDTNELVSVVCCTEAKGAKVPMYGSTIENIRRTRPSGASEDIAWVPTPIPIRPAAPARAPSPEPLPESQTPETKSETKGKE